jgi:serine/threonine protein kinase
VQIRQTFEAALERPDRDRAAYLRLACARDDELRREVESLLASHGESGDFLNNPVASFDSTLFYPEDDTTEYPPGYHVGPYQLEKRVGRGGMGSVWMATRFDSDFKMKFAVKLVKRGMDTTEILRRFRLERQVLASLDHPNIARLVDGGSTPDGLPYLVMEYVEGTRIDQYCEARQMSITDRLKLFRSVCSAVQYAHQNLVVHRDIKASNILVTAEGIPKLLDFGIAKLLRTEFSTLGAAETRADLRPMTLDYASPEQVRGEPITTATDVYSLGVLLYKLLTGKFPYGDTGRSPAALQTAICEREPIKPSAVILTDTKSSIPAATQKIEVGEETRDKARRRLKRKLRGDLDTIILMALRKEPRRRYASAEQFSADVRQYLEGHPVRARSNTFGYRTAKFVRRNALGVAAAVVLGLLLIAGSVISTNTAEEAIRRRDRAESQLQAARAGDLVQNRELLDSYLRIAGIEESVLNDPAGALKTYRKALERARAFVRDYPEQADARRGLVRAASKVAEMAPQEAMELHSEALTQLEALSQMPGADGQLHLGIVRTGRSLGLAQLRSGNLLAALASFSRALQIAEGLLEQDPGGHLRAEVAASNLYVGEVLARNGAPEAALAKYRKAFELYREIAGSTVQVRELTPQGYKAALAQVAAGAPPDLRKELEAHLAAVGTPGGVRVSP